MAPAPSPTPRAFLRLEVDRKSTRLNSSHEWISYAVFCLKKTTIGAVLESSEGATLDAPASPQTRNVVRIAGLATREGGARPATASAAPTASHTARAPAWG